MLLISAMRFAVSMHILNAYFWMLRLEFWPKITGWNALPGMRFDSSSGSGETFRRDSGPEGTEVKRTGKGAGRRKDQRLSERASFFKRNLDQEMRNTAELICGTEKNLVKEALIVTGPDELVTAADPVIEN